MTNKIITEEEKELRDNVKRALKAGKYTVYCVLRHVSTSGMMRHISFFTIAWGKPYHLDYAIEKLLDYKPANRGLKVGGCGMDMGFSVVYNLSGDYLHQKARTMIVTQATS